jgi:hypothetical protein
MVPVFVDGAGYGADDCDDVSLLDQLGGSVKPFSPRRMASLVPGGCWRSGMR